MNASVDSVFSRKIPHSQRKRSEDDRGHHHADRSYRSCAAQYVSARTENPVYTFRQRIYCISYFPRYRKSCFSHLLFSPAGRLPAYAEPVPLWKKSPSFCAALRNSVESDVYKYAALRKTKCVFYAFPRISGLLCHRIFPDQTFDAASLHPGTACCFHFSESRLWMAGVYLPADHVLYARR